jgi:hypothetical protein
MIRRQGLFVWLAVVLLVAASAPALAQQAATQPATKVASAAPLAGVSTAASAAAASTEKASSAAVQQGATDEVPQVKLGGNGTLTIKGFISATWFAQDQSFAFGNGQNAEWPTTDNTKNKWFNGGDVRNTRVTLAFDGPELADGWKFGAALEGDFFGGFNGSGAFSQQQATPRLRLAYADLKKGGTTLRIGQFWSPLFGEVPASLSHIAFPLGYGSAGMVGWRFPGVYLYQDLTPAGARTKAQLDLGVFQGSWNGPGNLLEHQSAGNVSFRNQIEAKFNFSGKAGGGAWKLYVAGHWDSKDLTGVGDIVPGADPKTLNGTAAELGGSFTIGPFLIHGNVYSGKAIGQQFGAITQFGDIKDTGGWLQLGYHIDKRWSVYGFYGFANPNDKDVLEWVGPTGRAKNQQAVGMIEWSLGQYRLGLEYLHDKLTLVNGNDLKGNEIALSAMYVF